MKCSLSFLLSVFGSINHDVFDAWQARLGYLIGMFAANAGKKAGEFYTPHEVSVLMSEVIAHHLKDRKTIQIYDSTSGSGSLLLNIGQAIAKHKEAKEFEADAQVTAALDAESYEAKIIQAAKVLAKEKSLKAAIKKDAAALHLKTKTTIETLSDKQVIALLESKWLTPLVDETHRLPVLVMSNLAAKLQALVEKYRITGLNKADATPWCLERFIGL